MAIPEEFTEEEAVEILERYRNLDKRVELSEEELDELFDNPAAE
jgi:hypothetical protein